ncbi:MAG: magnesium transporter CorA family protein [Hyphomicrobium sp.]
MINVYDCRNGLLVKLEEGASVGPDTVWIDLVNPTPEDEAAIEQALGLDVPTRDEAREIEASSRFYEEDGGTFMTTSLIYFPDKTTPTTGSVTFILKETRLVTVRYVEPRAFPVFASRAEKGAVSCNSGGTVMIGLIETIVDRIADVIERIQDDVEKLTHNVFNLNTQRRDSSRRLDVLLRSTGKEGDLVARVLESATSLDRTMHFFRDAARDRGFDPRILERLDVAQRDNHSLMEHTRFLTNRIGFLLEATLGMISTEQNQIIKLFSVMAVMLMPPTLVASIYGMNFRHMPELEWEYGYPVALFAMVLAAVIPYLYFRRKGWL